MRSFTFFIKEHKRTLHSFWFHKSYKNCKSRKKKNVKECSVLFIRLKKNLTFFFQNIFIYIYLYIYISIYICIYIFKKRTRVGHGFFCVLLQKNVAFFAFFYALCKRMLHSLRSFTFFPKERCML